MMLLGLVLGLLAGAALQSNRMRRKARERLRIPRTWPLQSRSVVNSDEQKVWTWMRTVFHDHVVMVKIAVFRFTIPIEKNQGREASEKWLDLLNGVYTTFTVCDMDGRVVGCVDVNNKRSLSKASRELKEKLLSDCGIPYTAVRSSRLPEASAMRTAFLGEMSEEMMSAHIEAQETRGGSSSFFADMDSFTGQRVQAAKDAALKALNSDAQDRPHEDAKKEIGFNPDGTGGLRLKPDRQFATQFDETFIQATNATSVKS